MIVKRSKPPIAVIIIGVLFVVAGAVGFIYHLRELDMHSPFSNDALLVLFVRLLAILGGILLLRGSNAGRWLLILWMAYHLILSFFHSLPEVITHLIILIVLICVLFHRKISPFF